jgi:catalase
MKKSDKHSSATGSQRPPLQPSRAGDPVAAQAVAIDALATAMPFNANKSGEFGPVPPVGQHETPASAAATASTVTEGHVTAKTGGSPADATAGGLAGVRTDSSGQRLTTNHGTPIGDNQNSLKAGLRGPVLLEDFVLREKITHFDHERIPERIVHARGSAAHGWFEAYRPLTEFTRAAPFQAAGKITPVFARFSTVAGERGSADTARDVRGFAVKFYTDEGNWDLVGNNMPVFFIQDAMKFPDLIHAVKPEPHNGMPQAASAHDTFWDFASLMPESMHTLMWVMSDRGIPRSLRMMQGFGVHTFRLINAEGVSHFVKFHWKPKAGTHSLVWDEAVKISGADPDFHRRDLWDAIEAGDHPEWELGLQIFTEAQAEAFSFDVLDATKLIPEELVPVTPVGRMVLDRNPDNFFAETEQVAFCTAHVVPGIDFSNDPLLAGRIHSYLDTQITRLGGVNFHEIPINAPLAPVHNNQRDGLHRRAIPRGRVAYEPNSLAGGCPFQAGAAGFVSFPQEIAGDAVRGKPEKFADHYTQATLFYESQTNVEQAHIAGGFRFELSKLTVPAIQVRMLASLVNVSKELAATVAEGLGLPVPPAMPKAMPDTAKPEIRKSSALSLTALPGDGGIRSRRIAILVADGVYGASIAALQAGLQTAGAVPVVIAARLGAVETGDRSALAAAGSLENSPSVLFDAVVLPDGDAGIARMKADGAVMEFVAHQYRHGKTILALGASVGLLAKAGIAARSREGPVDPGILLSDIADLDTALPRFIEAVGKHRHTGREMVPKSG